MEFETIRQDEHTLIEMHELKALKNYKKVVKYQDVSSWTQKPHHSDNPQNQNSLSLLLMPPNPALTKE